MSHSQYEISFEFTRNERQRPESRGRTAPLPAAFAGAVCLLGLFRPHLRNCLVPGAATGDWLYGRLAGRAAGYIYGRPVPGQPAAAAHGARPRHAPAPRLRPGGAGHWRMRDPGPDPD